MSLYFPHFPRNLTAEFFGGVFRLSRWSLLAILLTINLLALSPRLNTTYQSQLNLVLVHPFSASPHISLATAYWQNGLADMAKNELLVTQELTNRASTDNSKVLGTNTKPMEILASWQGEIKKLTGQLMFWQNITREKPLYRDAYLTMAALAYQLGKTDEARAAVDKARSFGADPEIVLKFEHLLKN